jgi:hypothetical protein
LLRTPTERATALATLASSVLQTRDHPSVLTHSVANELSPTPDRVPGTRDYLDASTGVVRNLDPTLPVSLDLLSYPGYPRQKTYTRFDLLGVNNYFGWYSGQPNHSTAKIADLAPYLRTMHGYYPTQALVMTEFGAEANFKGPASELGTYAFQADYVRKTLRLVRTLPFIDGAIYWTLREFAVKPYWYGGGGSAVDQPRSSYHRKGLISYDGTLKPAFAVASAEFAATPLYRPLPNAHSPLSWLALVAVVLILTVLGLVIVLDVWLFAGIRGAGKSDRDGDGGVGRVVPLRRERPRSERTYA